MGSAVAANPRRLTACVIAGCVGHAPVHCDSDPRAWGSGTMRVVLNSSSSGVLGGPGTMRVVLNSSSSGESDYDLLSRLGFWHDDRFGDDGFGWVDAVDAGYPPGYLGGRVFQPMLPSVLDAAWACAA